MSSIERAGAWPLRAAWVLLALLGTGCVGDALDGRSTAVVVVVLVGLWTGWAAALVALLVPRTTSLTALRILVPAGLAGAVACVAGGSTVDAADAVAVTLAAVAAVGSLLPWIGEAWVDGSAYGPERRLPLRPPVLVAYALTPITWLVVVLGAAVGPLLLACGLWVVGLVLTGIGWAAVVAGTRSLHQLSRRFVVIVPAGFVLHDPLTMPEPQLFLRRTITRLGPAVDGTDADDLTAGAAGLALQLDLSEPVDLLLRRGRTDTAAHTTTALLLTPTRPGRVLAAADERRIAVG